MGARIGVTTALVFALLSIGGSLDATACACGPSTPHLLVRGKSLYGVPWRIRMGEESSPGKAAPRSATLHFSLGRPDEYNEAGYYSSLPLPIPRAFVFDAISGSDIDSFPESDISGTASRRAVKLLATMSEGPPLTIETHLPPPSLCKRFHWLRGLVFFDQFYSADVEPLSIAAYDRDGRLLSRQPI